jgi:hypothetical protein
MLSAKGLSIFGFGLGVLVLGMGIPAAHASIIDVNSDAGPDDYNVENGIENPDVAISVSPAWAVAGMGYEWVSYAQTGCNTFVAFSGVCTSTAANPPAVAGNITLTGDGGVPATPTAYFYNNFTLPAGDSYSGTLNVWADDTARVYLDGVLLIDANPVLGGNCADAPVSCTAGMDYTVNLATLGFLTGGTNTLEIDAYQLIGGTPFGVMYNAAIDAEPSDAPEPASYVLMGLGLLGIAILIPRARRA